MSYLEENYQILIERIEALEKQNEDILGQLEELREKNRKSSKNKEKLEKLYNQFVYNIETNQKIEWTDFDLLLWYIYCMNKKGFPVQLTSKNSSFYMKPEMGKLVKSVIRVAKERNSENSTENAARNKVRDYIEYCVDVIIPEFKHKDPFYLITSDRTFNKNILLVTPWKKRQKMEDKELE